MNRQREMVCTRQHLAVAVYKRGIERVSRAESMRLVNEIIEAMADAMIEDGELKLRNFGVFSVREKKARMGRNPTTGEDAVITPRRVVYFYPAAQMKDAVADAPVSFEATTE